MEELKRDDEARAIWFELYADLSEGKPGMLGAVTSRAEAQVMRLSCIYALLDCSPIIRASHLRAALAVWKYCEASAAFVFGDALGDSIADEILHTLRSRTEGITRHEIRDHFQRHKSSAQIGVALNLLAEHGLARYKKEDSGGRPTERWFALMPSRAVSAISAESHKANGQVNAHSAHTAPCYQPQIEGVVEIQPRGGANGSIKYPD